MAGNLINLIEEVQKLYASSDRKIALWMSNSHVKVVAQWCDSISKQKKANTKLLIASAYLHDISDVWINRTKFHDKVSNEKAQKLLRKHNFTSSQIEETLEIISTHSAYPDNPPKTLEQKILSTADAIAHLKTDFYITFTWNHYPTKLKLDDHKKWLLDKIERDYHQKIFWKEYKDLTLPNYHALKLIFSI